MGEPSSDHATPATSGGTKSGSMPAVAMRPLQGVLVRTTIHAKARPIATAMAVPPAQAMKVLRSARPTLGLLSTAVKLPRESAVGWKPSTTGLAPLSAP